MVGGLKEALATGVDGVLFDKDQTRIIQFPEGKTGSYVIPDSVRSIENWAFRSYDLSRIIIPPGITNIGALAFVDCTELREVYFEGNAPTILPGAFSAASRAMVYYLPGTTGWDATLDGRPTFLWNAQIQTGDLSFGVRTNQFGFRICGTPYIPVLVEATTNLAAADWSHLQNIRLNGEGFFYFNDPEWRQYPGRFYRVGFPR